MQNLSQTHKLTQHQIEALIKYLPIKIAWFIYVYMLQKYGGDEAHSWQFDKWQHDCVFEIFQYKFVCINRCRAGSKTRDMSALCVFFRLRGLVVVWMSSNRKQLIRAQIYWNENYFVKRSPVTISKDFIYLKDGLSFQVFVLKKGLNNDRGPRAHCIFYDEMCDMSDDLVENTRAFSGGMDYDGSPIFWIHFSTPKINSAFQIACEQFHTITNDCTFPSWFSVNYITLQKKTLARNKFLQEMMCDFVSMAGCVFDGHILRGHCPDKLQSGIFYGQDPNARGGYCVAGVQYTVDYKKAELVFLKNFGAGAQGKKLMLEFLVAESHKAPHLVGGIEMETNGVGLPVWDDFCAMGGKGLPVAWDDLEKIRRVNNMNKAVLYIPTEKGKEYVECYNQINAVSLTEDGTKIDKPKDMAWHFADCTMHACQSRAIVWV